MTRTPTRRRTPAGPARRGFTLVELLVVFVILSILIALLLPAISGAVRTAKTSAASTEISQLAQALAQFKSQYGVYPPSRIVLSETGNYLPSYLQSSDADRGNEAMALGPRSVSYLRRIWPKMVLSTSGPLYVTQVPTGCYDFNGDMVAPTVDSNNLITEGQVHILDGAECLAFFLGGLPGFVDGGIVTTGFAKNPANPAIAAGNSTLGTNRSQPLYEFRPGRLADNYPIRSSGSVGNGFPEYLDGLTGPTPQPFAYFSSYEGAGYDPDDVNYAEEGTLGDGSTVTPAWTSFGTPLTGIGGWFFNRPAASFAPNPYTNGSALKMPGTTNPEYVNKNTFQIISAGLDSQFGFGGTYKTTGEVTPFPTPKGVAKDADYVPEFGAPANLARTLRQREHDNLTNFKGGRLD
ncbi:type II secretion system protein [Paludisphaera mucosa]|uniref:Prepilin-type N-terminal cleavage/methylation domain-containing protein n=1 Tax=Paludisphaera mucosa TaxID=3030827 RepID=A0ABT6F6Z2_9BACT|nr:prepilin-type N-terminal cleavage/methylation domain-containing protein [Paludisphaera mucosa]MDG3003324.1 prepilin-type N-terminal cleavage/methylation domain-containing protein [Paludisphaera mucosa]